MGATAGRGVTQAVKCLADCGALIVTELVLAEHGIGGALDLGEEFGVHHEAPDQLRKTRKHRARMITDWSSAGRRYFCFAMTWSLILS